MIETVICSTTEELAQLRDEWEALETPDGAYYTTHRFVSAWWGSYQDAPGYRLHVVVVRQDGRAVGIAPFAFRPEERDGRTVDVLRWASHGDYMCVLVAHDAAAAAPATVMARVLDELQRIIDDGEAFSVHLPSVQSESDFAWHVRTSQRYHQKLTFLIENPYIDLRRPRTVPSHARKYRNQFLRDREASFTVFRGDEHGILERIAEVHRAEKEHLVEARSRTERHSLYEDDRRVEHLRRVFHDTDDTLTFAFHEGDAATGRVLAYRTVFRHGRRLFSWNSAYLPEMERYRMGKVLQLQIVEHLEASELTDEIDEFDLGAGKYPWKFEWTPLHRPTYRFLLKPGTPKTPTITKPTTMKPITMKPESEQPMKSQPSAPVPSRLPLWRRAARRGVRETLARLPERHADTVRRIVRTRRPRRGTVVWYVPHADDESIFMGGAIASERGRRNIVVLLTRGDASQAIAGVGAKLGRALSVDEFVAARDLEFRAALSHLGVREQDVVRANLPDGALTAELVLEVVRRQARRHPGASHRTMSYLDVHADHAAAGRALRLAHAEGLVRDARFYLPVPQVVDERAARVELDPTAIKAKAAALREYQQWRPEEGRLAVGWRSVADLIVFHRRTPHERVHGPDLD
ncbi:GNAT family N-acetyltransferase [Ornithinimicrobium tianjinense]|uniref:BioF2-like acetyltransferase domain-containing protein n=1 Tax=Ornithinimicrobium tianjinense TaxID=1195761 RepID=A0A917BLW1_9MICO|nr:GNAT family N-acetyltransferase [Ornithinimicrobium tianjinense]GGF51274.1 hypothetical protein GCM10011366_18860 [Ornithinimicrobium tianjinense]